MKQGNISKLIRRILACAIAVACIAYIVYFFYENRGDLRLLLRFDLLTIIFILVMHFVYQIFYGLRFQTIVEKCSGSRIPLLIWLKLLIVGRFLNHIFPQLGNVYRGASLKRDYGVPYTRYITAYVSLAWLDTTINLLLAALILFVTAPELKVAGVTAWGLLTAIAAAVAIVPALTELIFRSFKPNFRYLSWLHEKLHEVFEVTVRSVRDLRYLLTVVVLGVLQFSAIGVMFFIVFNSMGIKARLPELALFYALFKISTHIILSPGNLGLRELAYGVLSTQIGIGMGEGIVAAAVLRMTGYLFDIIAGPACGGLSLLRDRRRYIDSKDELLPTDRR